MPARDRSSAARALPMAFARQRRLQRARQMLEEAETNQTVT
jgi:hypothetical protein